MDLKLKNYFLRYRKSMDCEIDFNEMFDDQIVIVEAALIKIQKKSKFKLRRVPMMVVY